MAISFKREKMPDDLDELFKVPHNNAQTSTPKYQYRLVIRTSEVGVQEWDSVCVFMCACKYGCAFYMLLVLLHMHVMCSTLLCNVTEYCYYVCIYVCM